MIKKILQEILKIENFLKDYYMLNYTDDFSGKKVLSEEENHKRESIVTDIENIIYGLEVNFQNLSESDWKSESQILEDLVYEAKYTLKRLNYFAADDEDMKKLFDSLKLEIRKFQETFCEGKLTQKEFISADIS